MAGGKGAGNERIIPSESEGLPTFSQLSAEAKLVEREALPTVRRQLVYSGASYDGAFGEEEFGQISFFEASVQARHVEGAAGIGGGRTGGQLPRIDMGQQPPPETPEEKVLHEFSQAQENAAEQPKAPASRAGFGGFKFPSGIPGLSNLGKKPAAGGGASATPQDSQPSSPSPLPGQPPYPQYGAPAKQPASPMPPYGTPASQPPPSMPPYTAPPGQPEMPSMQAARPYSPAPQAPSYPTMGSGTQYSQKSPPPVMPPNIPLPSAPLASQQPGENAAPLENARPSGQSPYPPSAQSPYSFRQTYGTQSQPKAPQMPSPDAASREGAGQEMRMPPPVPSQSSPLIKPLSALDLGQGAPEKEEEPQQAGLNRGIAPAQEPGLSPTEQESAAQRLIRKFRAMPSLKADSGQGGEEKYEEEEKLSEGGEKEAHVIDEDGRAAETSEEAPEEDSPEAQEKEKPAAKKKTATGGEEFGGVRIRQMDAFEEKNEEEAEKEGEEGGRDAEEEKPSKKKSKSVPAPKAAAKKEKAIKPSPKQEAKAKAIPKSKKIAATKTDAAKKKTGDEGEAETPPSIAPSDDGDDDGDGGAPSPPPSKPKGKTGAAIPPSAKAGREIPSMQSKSALAARVEPQTRAAALPARQTEVAEISPPRVSPPSAVSSPFKARVAPAAPSVSQEQQEKPAHPSYPLPPGDKRVFPTRQSVEALRARLGNEPQEQAEPDTYTHVSLQPIKKDGRVFPGRMRASETREESAATPPSSAAQRKGIFPSEMVNVAKKRPPAMPGQQDANEADEPKEAPALPMPAPSSVMAQIKDAMQRAETPGKAGAPSPPRPVGAMALKEIKGDGESSMGGTAKVQDEGKVESQAKVSAPSVTSTISASGAPVLGAKPSSQEKADGAAVIADEIYFAYAREKARWIYDIYRMGGMSIDEFRAQVKDRMSGIDEGGQQTPPPKNDAFQKLNKELEKKFRK